MLILTTRSSALSTQACTFPVLVVKSHLWNSLILVGKGETQNIHVAQRRVFLHKTIITQYWIKEILCWYHFLNDNQQITQTFRTIVHICKQLEAHDSVKVSREVFKVQDLGKSERILHVSTRSTIKRNTIKRLQILCKNWKFVIALVPLKGS